MLGSSSATCRMQISLIAFILLCAAHKIHVLLGFDSERRFWDVEKGRSRYERGKTEWNGSIIRLRGWRAAAEERRQALMGSFGRHPQNKAHPIMLLCFSHKVYQSILLLQQLFSFRLTSQILLSRLCCNISGFNVKIFPNHRSSRAPFSRHFNRFFMHLRWIR